MPPSRIKEIQSLDNMSRATSKVDSMQKAYLRMLLRLTEHYGKQNGGIIKQALDKYLNTNSKFDQQVSYTFNFD